MQHHGLRQDNSHEAYEDVICFEDCGDIEMSIIYFNQKEQNPPSYAELKGFVKLGKYSLVLLRSCLRHELTIPVKGNEKLDAEQRGIIEFMTREGVQ